MVQGLGTSRADAMLGALEEVLTLSRCLLDHLWTRELGWRTSSLPQGLKQPASGMAHTPRAARGVVKETCGQITLKPPRRS